MERLEHQIQKSQAFFKRVLGFLQSLFADNNCLKQSWIAVHLYNVCAVSDCRPNAAINVVSEPLVFNVNKNKGVSL